MTMLLTEKTKQEKITNEAQKKRNLFGLGLTSLIAACSAAENAAENGANLDKRPTTELTAAPLEPAANTPLTVAAIASNEVGYDPERNDSAINDLQITVTPGQRGLDSGDDLIFRIADGDHDGGSRYASVYTGLAATNKHDLVVLATNFGEVTTNSARAGGIYIFWDIKGKTAADLGVTTEDTIDGDGEITGTIYRGDAGKTLALKHLEVKGSVDNILSTTKVEFYHIGGEADQADMVFRSSGTDLNIVWDVAQYATTDGATELTLDTSPRILQISKIGEFEVRKNISFIKINDNNNYDMIAESANIRSTYIFWDVAKYYDANATDFTPAINLASADADTINATHGLLKIIGTTTTGIIMKAADKSGLTDIDGGGTNDIAFEYGGNTYILFGEKVANINEESGKAISHTVSLSEVATGTFYSTADARTEDTAGTRGFFDFDLDGQGGNDIVANVGYRFVGTEGLTTLTDIKGKYDTAITPTDPALSEEAYWDIA